MMATTAAPVTTRGPVHWLDAVVDIAVGIALVGELVVIMGNVLGRLFFNEPLLWSDEVAGFALSIMAFLGGAIAYRRDAHVRVQTIVAMLPPSWSSIATSLRRLDGPRHRGDRRL